MDGVFEVEVDGVEHDHGLQHHDEPVQVSETRHIRSLRRIKRMSENLYASLSCRE